jgi:peptide deformylase
MVNPEIEPVGNVVAEDWEGCLSIPDLRGRVSRATEIRVRALNRHGRQLSMTASGFPARVIQHETDHLDGVLFLDRMTSLESLTYLAEYARYWEAEEAAVSDS